MTQWFAALPVELQGAAIILAALAVLFAYAYVEAVRKGRM